MQGDRETPAALTTVNCTYDHDKLLLSNTPLQVTLSSNEGHLLLALIEGVTDKEDLIRRVWGERGLIVSDNSYYKALHTLRHYLSEVGLDRSILKTLPRRGVVLLLKIERINDNTPPDLNGKTPPSVPDGEAMENAEPARSAPPCLNTSPVNPEQTVDRSKEHAPPESSIPAPTARPQRYKKYLFYLTLFSGFALPTYYAYMLFTKPIQLEQWRLLSQSQNAKFYVEQGDKTPLSYIMSGMTLFGPAVGLTGTHYYVKKTQSELLVSCEKPESKGEALCTNYLIIEQKK